MTTFYFFQNGLFHKWSLPGWHPNGSFVQWPNGAITGCVDCQKKLIHAKTYIMTGAAVKINDFFFFGGGIAPLQGDSFQTSKWIHLAHNIRKVLDGYLIQIQGFTGSSPLDWQRHKYTVQCSIMLKLRRWFCKIGRKQRHLLLWE